MSDEKKTADVPAAKSAGSLLGKAVIGLFVGGVILVECALAYMWLPGPEDVVANQSKADEEAKKKADEDAQKKEAEEKAAVAELDLGEYAITSHQPAAGNTLFINFKLVGTVAEAEQADVKALFERNKHRFREQILVEIRNSAVPDLTDPGLGLIKRRILEKSNALFGKPVLHAVVFSDFSFVEQ